MANLPDEWMKAALHVTGYFEDSADPWGGVSDNFDGMGVSLGVLQWNFGSNSLQPLAKAAGKAAVTAAMPTIGNGFWSGCNAAGTGWKPIIAPWFSGIALKAGPLRELKAYTRSDPFVAQQVAAARTVAAGAFKACEKWALDDANWTQATQKLFCWFFDVWTQNGGLKGLTPADVAAFRTANPSAVKKVCDWLAAATGPHKEDARKNAVLWRVAMQPRVENLFLLSYLRALKAKQQWRVDVLNRKGTLATGSGWVHKSKFNVAPITGSD